MPRTVSDTPGQKTESESLGDRLIGFGTADDLLEVGRQPAESLGLREVYPGGPKGLFGAAMVAGKAEGGEESGSGICVEVQRRCSRG